MMILKMRRFSATHYVQTSKGEKRMKRITIALLAFGILTVLLVTGCAKQPTEDINAAQKAVDAVTAEGAQKYAPEDAKKLAGAMTAAMEEIKIQDGKTLKNYSKAKEMLAKVKSDAEALKTDLPVKKEQAKTAALSAQEAAKTAVQEAKTILTKAPKGKGSKADIEALKADVKGLEDLLSEVNSAVESEDYGAATEKANSIKEKAAEVSTQITQAMEKVGKKTK
jgi:membrane protein involved in colicin uptake